MTFVIECGEVESVCVSSIRNWSDSPYRLRSLLEMLVKLRGSDISWASCMLCQVVHIVQRGEVPRGEQIDAFGGSLGTLTRACEDLGLRVSLTQVKRLQQTMFSDGPIDWKAVGSMAFEVQNRFIDELDS